MEHINNSRLQNETEAYHMPEHVRAAVSDAVVAILLFPSSENVEEVRCQIRTAFVLERRGKWYLVTASHVARDFEQHRDNGGIFRIGSNGLGSEEPHPFALPLNRSFSFERFVARIFQRDLDEVVDERRWDAAFIVLEEFQVMALKAIGVTPLRLTSSVELAQNAPEDNERRFAVAGFPVQCQEWNHSSESHLGYYQLAILPIEMSQEEYGWPASYFFEAAWVETDKVNSVNGMSGGPIVAYDENQIILIGIQTHEKRQSSESLRLRCFPADHLVEILDQLVLKVAS